MHRNIYAVKMLKGPGMTNAENGLHLCEINIISKYVTII
jgi:hypothetical protein